MCHFKPTIIYYFNLTNYLFFFFNLNYYPLTFIFGFSDILVYLGRWKFEMTTMSITITFELYLTPPIFPFELLGSAVFFPQNSNFPLGLGVQRTCLVVMAVIVRKSFSSMSSLIFKHSHAQNSCAFSLSGFGARYNSSVSSTGKVQLSPFNSGKVLARCQVCFNRAAHVFVKISVSRLGAIRH